jgi:Ca-activated chloride channel family protein
MISNDLFPVMGQLVLSTPDASPLPLEKTSVHAQISGPIGLVTITQQFSNPFQQPVELDYRYPLPHEASLTDFEFRIANKLIKADLEERQQAQEHYAEAKTNGQQAGLLEQNRPNLFSLHLANVLPDEKIQVTLRFQQRLKFSDGEYEFVYPMGVTPKYDSPTHPAEGQDTQVIISSPNEVVGLVEISLSIDAGVPVHEPTSPSHSLSIIRLDEHRLQVNLPAPTLPDQDFVVRYSLAEPQISPAIWTSAEKEGQVFLATLTPPSLGEDYQIPAREFVFVLDRSGSMDGMPINQACNALRACLRTLNNNDAFYILAFDDRLEWFKKEVSMVDQQAIDQADAYLNTLQARGGTEILLAIEAALQLPQNDLRKRYIVFLTDGAVSAEERALQKLQALIGASRVFTFGIGPSVNRALLAKMAQFGHGTAEFLQLDEDIEGAIIRFQDRVSYPMLVDLRLEWVNARGWDLYPKTLPDLYAGQPIEICGWFAASGPQPQLIIHGAQQDQKISLGLPLQSNPQNDPVIARLWARARVDDLLDQIASDPQQLESCRQQIIGLALSRRLVTPYTAFIGIAQDIVNPNQTLQTLHISQPLPKGLNPASFGTQALLSRAYPSPAPASLSPSAARPASTAMPSPGNIVTRSMASFKKQSFMSKLMDAAPEMEAAKDLYSKPEPSIQKMSTDQVLRELARTQSVDGSWKQDLDLTAAALLAFIRNGHTTRTGNYRQVVKKAAGYLEKVLQSQQSEAYIRLVLAEFYNAIGKTSTFTESSHAQISSSTEPLILAALAGQPTQPAFNVIKTLPDLRLSALLGWKIPVSPELEITSLKDQTWLAAIKI